MTRLQRALASVLTTALRRGLITGTIFLAMIGSGSCAKRGRVTHIYGVVIDTNNQPVEGVQIEIEATRRWTLNQGDLLKTVYTDKKGEYSVTVEPEKRHSSVQVINQYFDDAKLNDKYSSHVPTKNGQNIRNCCSADISQKTECNFILLPR